EAARSIEDDGQRRLVAVRRELQRLPAEGASLVEQPSSSVIDAARLAEQTRPCLRLENSQDVGAAGIHAGSVRHQVKEEAVVAAKRWAVVEQARLLQADHDG